MKFYRYKKGYSTWARGLAVYLIFNMMFQFVAPTHIYALTGGPSQPEVQGFTPIGTSDMVDPFSGDFSYNIPLLDVDGYPINLAYSSGVSMDQEASWVGLGWNINPGVVNRNVRGIPDDFAGDVVTRTLNKKPNRTFAVSGGVGTEFFGTEVEPGVAGADFLNLSANLGINYNNYSGFGLDLSINASVSIGNPNTSPLNAGLGLNSSSDNGLNVSPSLSFSERLASDGGVNTNLGLKAGSSFNSRQGLSTLSVNASISQSTSRDQTYTNRKGDSKSRKVGSSYGLAQAGASFNLMQPTYTPQVSLPMKNLSLSGNFSLGIELFGGDGQAQVSASYSQQVLAQNTINTPSYGYLHIDKAQQNPSAMMDFNRELDGAYSPNIPNMPIANLTYDIISASGQGAGGSFRPFRSEHGYVRDPLSSSNSSGGSIGGEFSPGNLVHAGADISVNVSNTFSGMWNAGNQTKGKLSRYNANPADDYEAVYYKEANERSVETDEAFYSAINQDKAIRVRIEKGGPFYVKAIDKWEEQVGSATALNNIPDNKRKKRQNRTQLFSYLTRGERNLALEDYNTIHQHGNAAFNHHLQEVTVLGGDGSRYVYGVPAYNTYKKEVTFAVGDNENGIGGLIGNCSNGLVPYPSSLASTTNNKGLDNYYDATETPPYAHSYLLTSIVSQEYVDIDGVRGPSDGDIGNWTKFEYTRVHADYKWRVPFEAGMANYSQGIISDKSDDKASYVYGQKEIWMLTKIETKNYIAIFELGDRYDGHGVQGEHGGLDGNATTKYLKKILLFSKPDYLANPATAVPLKVVHFVYDYSLCQGIPNNNGGAATNAHILANQGGKLTLKEVFFTYQDSDKARFSPYKFDYGDINDPLTNPVYNLKGYDRWGNYTPNPADPGCDALTSPLGTADYPYTEQSTNTDLYAQAWHLRDISLPSGGRIQVHYESDDYAYVQHRKAMQMFKVVGVRNLSNGTNVLPSGPAEADVYDKNHALIVEIPDNGIPLSEYFEGIDQMYFKTLVKFAKDVDATFKYDYVPGYSPIESYGQISVSGGIRTVYVQLKPVSLSDNDNADYSPVAKTAIQYGRLYLSNQIFDISSLSSTNSFDEQVINAIVQVFKNFVDGFRNPNKVILNNLNKCRKAVMHKSWIRLNKPDGFKKGGGVRVKKILMSDEWDSMTGSGEGAFGYGQEYDYTTTDDKTGRVISSGVASYEPQIGGDENALKQPIYYDEEKLMAPDDRFYQETPLGEAFYPSASVGYSKVTIRNLQHSGVNRNATGKVVHEFYTAKDFPTISKRTDVEAIPQRNPFSIGSLLTSTTKDHISVSQGYVIECNDMHGKPKKQSTYQEDKSEPISSVEYTYLSDALVSAPIVNPITGQPLFSNEQLNARKLSNTAKVILPDGTVQDRTIGVMYENVTDFRYSNTYSTSFTTQINLDAFLIATFPVAFPAIWPSISTDERQFQSTVNVKVIQKFGLVDEVIATDLGSKVSTKNLAYDGETGQVLLTETRTNYNDEIYTLNYPAYWYYDLTGPAYKNIHIAKAAVFNSNGTATIANGSKWFAEGDELGINNNSRGWVTGVNGNQITVQLFDGSPLVGNHTIKVLRSGRRNMMQANMATITTLKNPLDNFQANVYENVLQAAAMEFSDTWRTYCDCYNDEFGNPISTNPFVLGVRGNWRMIRSFAHLTPRTQSRTNGNTNTRVDGMFTSYTPFYKLNANKWEKDPKNWTFTSIITEFNPFGQELENQDALGRFSSATFGYNQTLATSVAANARYKEIGFDNFEDNDFINCADRHFDFLGMRTTDVSHTGFYSVKVGGGQKANLRRQLQFCEIPGCDLAINEQSVGNFIGLTIAGGTAPYVFNWDFISGNTNINLVGSQLQLFGTGYTIEVQVTDSKGCGVIKTITR